jgi:PadR family transcriptional regulator, regulatory protein PadR
MRRPTPIADDFDTCPCAGKNLDRLLQPAMLALLAREDQHGYLLVQHLAALPFFGGQKPDATGIYRYLRQMEERGLVTFTWDLSETGPAKRLYHLTEAGQACLVRWVESLTAHREAIDGLLNLCVAATSTTPPTG